MKFPDAVTIRRPSAADEFGNPAASFAVAYVSETFGFEVAPGELFLPADVDLRLGDRVSVNGHDYAVEVAPEHLRSPAKTVLVSATLAPLEASRA